MWSYQARLVRVKDADTMEMIIDLGFGARLELPVRLAGIDAPEKDTGFGQDATRFVRDWFADVPAEGFALRLESQKPYVWDKYRRYLARVSKQDGQVLNDVLISRGYAKPYVKR